MVILFFFCKFVFNADFIYFPSITVAFSTIPCSLCFGGHTVEILLLFLFLYN